MLKAARYARTRKVPFFGICLGMECAVIEYARNVCGLQADSSEFKSKPMLPQPLLASFIDASYRHKLGKQAQTAPAESAVKKD